MSRKQFQPVTVERELIQREVVRGVVGRSHRASTPGASPAAILTPNSHRMGQDTCIPRSQHTIMGLMHVHGCVHTEVCMWHHDHRWVPTPNTQWDMVWNVVKGVCDALAHAVWPRGEVVSRTMITWVCDTTVDDQLNDPNVTISVEIEMSRVCETCSAFISFQSQRFYP